jgi:hypothetical protein
VTTWTKNQNGFKDSSEMFRTVKGQRFVQWAIWASDERVAAYRAAGLRVRRFVGELFIHTDDQKAAAEIDTQRGEN